MEKDIINKRQDDKGQHSLEVAWSNPLCAYCYKKTEKLSCAVYVVTNFIPDTDPIRFKLRDKSLCLLAKIISLRQLNKKHSSTENIGHDTEHALSEIKEILALLTVAESCRYVSTMNATMLKSEYIKLANILQNREGELGERYQFAPQYFDVPFSREMKQSQFEQDVVDIKKYNTVSDKPVWDKGHENTVDDMSKRMSLNVSQSKTYDKRHIDGNNISSGTQVKSNIRRTQSGKTNIRHNERRQIILNLLDNKEKVGVKDVVDVIRDCSEKTIQRELLSLVKQGVLKKEGERRWSVYSLRS